MEPIVLAVTGASALQLAERSIELLLKKDKVINLVLSKGSYKVFHAERGINIPIDPITQESYWREKFNTQKGTITCYRWNDNSAPIASGSYKTKGMVIVPCSMGTIGRISSGISKDLIERCADVHLKEGRPLILAPRESPFNLIHLRNLTSLTEAGAKIVPPIPAWYNNPKTLEDMIDFIVVRLFDTLGEDIKQIDRWNGPIK